MKNKNSKIVLDTIGKNKDQLAEMVYSFDKSVNETNLLEKILINLKTNKVFAKEFVSLMPKEFNRADGVDVKGWSSIIGVVGTTAGGLLNGYYKHDDVKQANNFQGELELLKKQNEAKEKNTMMIFAGIGGLLLLGGIVFFIINKSKKK